MSKPNLTIQSKPLYSGHFFTDFISLPEDILQTTEEKVVFIYGNEKTALNFRKSSEKFYNHFNNIKVYDGGYIVEHTENHAERLFSLFQNNYLLPVLVGFNKELVTSLTKKWQMPVHVISHKIKEIENSVPQHKNAYIGYQRHVCSYENILHLENHSYHSLSLGKMRSFPSVNEAVMRDATVAHICFDALKWSDCPFLDNNLPTGLTAEELCQMSWYLGRAQHLKVLILDDYSSVSHSDKASMLASEVMWYFLEGLNIRTTKHPSQSKEFSEFIVLSENMDTELIFLKDNTSGRWWLKLYIHEKPYYLSCTIEEYDSTLKNDIPDRIMKFIESVSEDSVVSDS